MISLPLSDDMRRAYEYHSTGKANFHSTVTLNLGDTMEAHAYAKLFAVEATALGRVEFALVDCSPRKPFPASLFGRERDVLVTLGGSAQGVAEQVLKANTWFLRVVKGAEK